MFFPTCFLNNKTAEGSPKILSTKLSLNVFLSGSKVFFAVYIHFIISLDLMLKLQLQLKGAKTNNHNKYITGTTISVLQPLS